MMLRIYWVALEMVKDVARLAEMIALHDRDQARQAKRSSVSVVLNIAEGGGSRGGTRRERYLNALSSARETLANLEAAVGLEYIPLVDAVQRNRFDHIIGTLVKIVH